jgi:hypothetical protein
MMKADEAAKAIKAREAERSEEGVEDAYPAGAVKPSEIAEPVAVHQRPDAGWSPIFGDDPYLREVALRVDEELQQVAARYARGGRSLDELGSPRELADRMLAAIPKPSRWNQLIGPFYGPGQLSQLLGGISRQAVADRRNRRTLLGLKTSDGSWVYPTFQFDQRNEVIEGLPEILQLFDPREVDGWTVAGWLRSPLRSLGGETPIESLQRGAPEAVVAAARDAARRFAS